MKIGISAASFYPMYAEDAVNKIIELGAPVTEIFFNCPREMKKSFLLPTREKLNNNNCNIKSIHPFTSSWESFLLFSEYYPRFEDGVELYKRYFEAANILGAKIIVIHGDQCSGKITDEEYYERFEILANEGKKSGVIVAQENVNRFRSQSINFILNMKKYLYDDVSFVLDIKQSIRSGHSPYDVCEAMGGNIVHVHVNDHDKENDCLLPGCGDMDYIKLHRMLTRNGFDGDFVIEVYRKNYLEYSELRNSMIFLQKKLNLE